LYIKNSHLVEGGIGPGSDVGDKIQLISTPYLGPLRVAGLTVRLNADGPTVNRRQRDVNPLPGMKSLKLLLTKPLRITTAAGTAGVGRSPSRLLELPRKTQLRTSLRL